MSVNRNSACRSTVTSCRSTACPWITQMGCCSCCTSPVATCAPTAATRAAQCLSCCRRGGAGASLHCSVSAGAHAPLFVSCLCFGFGFGVLSWVARSSRNILHGTQPRLPFRCDSPTARCIASDRRALFHAAHPCQGCQRAFVRLQPALACLRALCDCRLDKESSGLLLLTTDHQLVHQLTSPNRHVEKEYVAQLAVPLSDQQQQQMVLDALSQNC